MGSENLKGNLFKGNLFNLAKESGKPFFYLVDRLDRLVDFGYELEDAFNLLKQYITEGNI